MTITLSPELEAMAQRHVARGRYPSIEDYVVHAIYELDEWEKVFGDTVDEQRAKLEQSLQEAERGECISVEEFMVGMQEMKADWAKTASSVPRSPRHAPVVRAHKK